MAAGLIKSFGFGVIGIRGVSILFGTLAIPLTYLIGRQLWGRSAAFVSLIATLSLAFSFWSLLYSRVGLRHITLPFFALLTFLFLWRALFDRAGNVNQDTNHLSFVLAGISMGVGFYTYFASRGVPLIVLGFILYLGMSQRSVIIRKWRGLLLFWGVAILLGLPLLITLQSQPEAETRVAELALPMFAAQAGDYAPLWQHITQTLGMFHATGDPEWLYNIPQRPIFGPIGAIFFWLGVLSALYFTLMPLLNPQSADSRNSALGTVARRDPAVQYSALSTSSALLLLWWLAGISPAFLSIPPASFGHTILAQPAVYLLTALPLIWIKRLLAQRVGFGTVRWVVVLLGGLLLFNIGWRDLTTYFIDWPQRGNVRFLYRADIENVADFLQQTPNLWQTGFGITGVLAGPWDRLALDSAVSHTESSQGRWFNPERVLLLEAAGTPAQSFIGYPNSLAPIYAENYLETGVKAGGYLLARVTPPPFEPLDPVCFSNGLCLEGMKNQVMINGSLDLVWRVARPLTLPEIPLISNPPPPNVYTGPRLQIFTHILDANDQLISGDDGFWIDGVTLQEGDRFLQRHYFSLLPETLPATIAVGLYDPKTGERILLEDGEDQWRVPINNE